MNRWMQCAPCDTTWRGEEIPCFLCNNLGVGSNGPVLHGGATYTAANAEAA